MTGGNAQALASLVVILPLLGLWAYCLVDFSRTDEREMRTFPRETWLVLLIILNVFGGIMWLRLGRPTPPAAHR